MKASAGGAMVAVVVGAVLAGGCASLPRRVVRVGEGDPGHAMRGVFVCGGGDAEVALDPEKPLVVFVPGRGDSGDRYTELAWRFERDGAQAVCFGYDDREALDVSSGQLIQALEALEARLTPGRITIVGHSLGGLVARRALVLERPDRLRTAPGFSYALVAVATPFGGVRASQDCGRTWLQILTLGTSALVCSMVSGNAWKDLPPSSRFIRAPGTLVPEVAAAYGVVTEERGACRRWAAVGGCEEEDVVFTPGEQRSPVVERDPRWTRVEVTAGHDEIVGAIGTPPRKLFAVMEAEGILAPLPARVARP